MGQLYLAPLPKVQLITGDAACEDKRVTTPSSSCVPDLSDVHTQVSLPLLPLPPSKKKKKKKKPKQEREDGCV